MHRPTERFPSAEADAGTRPVVRGASRQDKIGTVGVCLALLAVSGYLWFESLGYREPSNADVGPGAEPRMVALACAVVALILVVRILRLPTVEASDEPRLGSLRVVATVAVVALATVALPLLGYTVTMTVLMVAAGHLAGARTWWSNLLLAGATTWVSLILFSRVFMVPLPLGPLDRLLGG